MTRDLVVQGAAELVVPPPEQNVLLLASRMSKVYPQPQQKDLQLTDEEFTIATEMALANGLNPLAVTKEFHVWKDFRTKQLHFQLHFARNVRWAQSVEPFRTIDREVTADEKKELQGISEGDFVWERTLIRQSQETVYNNTKSTILNAAIQAGKTFEEAQVIANSEALKVGMTGIGVVKYHEVYDNQGKIKKGGPGIIPGRTPGHTRAKIRALTDAIRQAYGVPTKADILSLGLPVPQGELAEKMAGMPEEISVEPEYIQKRYLELEAIYEEASKEHDKEVASLSPEELQEKQQERVETLRGDIVANDPGWLDEDTEVVDEVAFPVVGEGTPAKKDQPTTLTLGDIRQAIYRAGYPTERAQIEAVRTTFGKEVIPQDIVEIAKAIASLDIIQTHNLFELMKRLKILTDTSLDVQERLAAIPEIADAKENKPTTLKNAKPWLKKLAEVMAQNEEKMRVL